MKRAKRKPRREGKHWLKAAFVEKVKKDGWYCDGGHLWLHVSNRGKGKSYVFIYDSPVAFIARRGKNRGATLPPGTTREMGIGGGARMITLNGARDLAEEYNKLLNKGEDPYTERKRGRDELAAARGLSQTVDDLVTAWLKKRYPDNPHPQYRALAESTRKSEMYQCKRIRDSIGPKLPGSVTNKMLVYETPLGELWTSKPRTGHLLRWIMEKVFDIAVAENRSLLNPAAWKNNLDQFLQPQSHYTAVPRRSLDKIEDVAPFLAAVQGFYDRRLGGSEQHLGSHYALEFVILTCVRVGEVCKATWDEIEYKNDVPFNWHVPAPHRKTGYLTGKPRTIPVTKSMVAILDVMKGRRSNSSNAIFANVDSGQRYHESAILQVIRHHPEVPQIDVHGLRSSLLSWTEVMGKHDSLLAGQLDWLPPGIKKKYSAVMRANAIDHTLEPRRVMMGEWDSFCSVVPTSANFSQNHI